jgi:hypothetical protein
MKVCSFILLFATRPELRFGLVNVLKLGAQKDKTQFRDYENACDRVKTFYKEQHGEKSDIYGTTRVLTISFDRETNSGV